MEEQTAPQFRKLMQDIIPMTKIMDMIVTLMKNTWAMKIIMHKKKKIIQLMIMLQVNTHMDGMTSLKKKNWKVSSRGHMILTPKMSMMSMEPEKENIQLPKNIWPDLEKITNWA